MSCLESGTQEILKRNSLYKCMKTKLTLHVVSSVPFQMEILSFFLMSVSLISDLEFPLCKGEKITHTKKIKAGRGKGPQGPRPE